MKKVISLILAVVILCCMFTSCASKTDDNSPTVNSNSKDAVEIPAIIGTDLDSAKTIITALGLVPIVLEEYSLKQSKGNIDKCYPDVGSSVKKGSSVEITVSKGYASLYTTTMNASIVGSNYDFTIENSWVLDSLTIEGGNLNFSFTIEGIKTKYQGHYMFYDNNYNSYISFDNFSTSGIASYTKTSSERIVDQVYVNGDEKYHYKQSVSVSADIDSFNVDMPNTIYLKLPVATDKDYQDVLKIKILITHWQHNETDSAYEEESFPEDYVFD